MNIFIMLGAPLALLFLTAWFSWSTAKKTTDKFSDRLEVIQRLKILPIFFGVAACLVLVFGIYFAIIYFGILE